MRAISTVDAILQRVNRRYNDLPVEPKKPSTISKRPVLFLDEADMFVSEVRSLPNASERKAAMKDLAERTERGEVVASYNAASALNTYRREIGSWRPIRRTDLQY
jgi:hypothetical protein